MACPEPVIIECQTTTHGAQESSSHPFVLQSSLRADLDADNTKGLLLPATVPTTHVAFSFTERDQSVLHGMLFVVIYIGVWIVSALMPPGALLLLFLGWYTTGVALLVFIALCFLVPIKPSQRFRRFVCSICGRYFKEASVRFEHVPNPLTDRPTILCVSPHGVFALCWAFCLLTEELHHFRWCFSTMLRLSPLLRIVTHLTSYPSTAQKVAVIRHLQNRSSIALIPGGWHEASIHSHERDRIYIRKRQGFVKYALQYGYTITPSYAFGERTTYKNVQGWYRFRFFLNKHKIIGVLPWGRAACPLFPRPEFLHVVVGTPLDLPHIPHPTPEDVHRAHQAYMKAMVELYNRYKHQFYGEDAFDLELW